MIVDNETFLLLSAYRDGELSPGDAVDMERRLADDPVLRTTADRLDALSASIKSALSQKPAPPALHSHVVEELAFADGVPRRRLPDHWRTLAAAIVFGVAGGGLIGSGATLLGLAAGPDATTKAVLAGHLRGLVAQQPYDIATSSRHVVKPWFNGRTTIAPEVPDFAAQGFPLAGGRIDIVDGKPVPTLVYRRDQHVVSVTVTPWARDVTPGEVRSDGSAIERWRAGDLVYWAVSDLDADELRAFAALFRAETSRASLNERP